MNKIKVTVTYEKPTTSKFDALMAEYEAAKRCADETVAYYKPLADAAIDAKFDAIMEQLETIKEYAKRISEITNQSVCLSAGVHAYMRGDTCSSQYFSVEYITTTKDKFVIGWDNVPFLKESICNRYPKIINKWEEWRIYEQLAESAYSQLNGVIKAQKLRAQHQIDRLNAITKGGN